MSDLELCLFRHGRTAWNALGKYQGHADVDLDDLGHRQAGWAGERIERLAPVALYTSDLQRCLDTVAPAVNRTGMEAIKDVRLRERDVGMWSGQTREEIRSQFPEEYELWLAGSEVRPGGGETSAEMLARIRSFLDEMAATHQGTVVAVSHGGWIKAAAQWVLTQRIDRIGLGVVSQGSLSAFSYAAGTWRVEAYNDCGHLLADQPGMSSGPLGFDQI